MSLVCTECGIKHGTKRPDSGATWNLSEFFPCSIYGVSDKNIGVTEDYDFWFNAQKIIKPDIE